MLKRNRGDLKIMWSDPLSLALKRTPNLRAFSSAGVIKWERRKWRQEHVELACSCAGSELDSAP
jgi:hypothetical protein